MLVKKFFKLNYFHINYSSVYLKIDMESYFNIKQYSEILGKRFLKFIVDSLYPVLKKYINQTKFY